MFRKINIILPLIFLILLFTAAVAGFAVFEKLTISESVWMTFTTILTVGYGDLVPQTGAGRLLVILLVPLCIILFTYFMGLIIGGIIEFNISVSKRSKSMERKIKRMNNQIIVCGLNAMSQIIIDRIEQEKRNFVLIEPDESKCEPYIEKYHIIIGDPSEEDILRRAGIEKAEGLITTGSDAENVLIVLTARELNPGLRITSSAERTESESKLIKAGADKVISPERIGGTRIALSILQPAAVDFMDRVFISGAENFRINELLITEGSTLAGTTVRNAEIRNRYNLSVMAVKRKGNIITSGLADFQLAANDILIVFGKDVDLEDFTERTGSDSI